MTAGGSAAPSCSMTSNVENESTMTGVVRLTATNTISSTYKDDDSQLYQWQNTTQNDPFKYVTLDCYVDTLGKIMQWHHIMVQ